MGWLQGKHGDGDRATSARGRPTPSCVEVRCSSTSVNRASGRPVTSLVPSMSPLDSSRAGSQRSPGTNEWWSSAGREPLGHGDVPPRPLGLRCRESPWWDASLVLLPACPWRPATRGRARRCEASPHSAPGAARRARGRRPRRGWFDPGRARSRLCRRSRGQRSGHDVARHRRRRRPRGMVGHWRAGCVRVAAGLWFSLAGVAGSLLGTRSVGQTRCLARRVCRGHDDRRMAHVGDSAMAGPHRSGGGECDEFVLRPNHPSRPDQPGSGPREPFRHHCGRRPPDHHPGAPTRGWPPDVDGGQGGGGWNGGRIHDRVLRRRRRLHHRPRPRARLGLRDADRRRHVAPGHRRELRRFTDLETGDHRRRLARRTAVHRRRAGGRGRRQPPASRTRALTLLRWFAVLLVAVATYTLARSAASL